MTHGAWLTPDTIPGSVTCRTLEIPDDPNIIAAVSGALLPLIYPSNWQQFGAVTPAQIASEMASMYYAFLASECAEEQMVERYVYAKQAAQGVNGGDTIANTFVFTDYSTVRMAEGTNVSQGGANFTLQPGRYVISGWVACFATGDVVVRMQYVGGLNRIVYGDHAVTGTTVDAKLWFHDAVNIPAQTGLTISIRGTVGNAGDGQGRAINEAGIPEVYGEIQILRLGDLES